MTPRSKQIIKMSLRIFVGFTLLAFVITRLDTEAFLHELMDLGYWPLAMALLMQTAAKFIWAFRWKEILRAYGIDRRLKELMALIFIGLFFNSFLPTAVGGDLIRGYYAARGKEGVLTNYVVLFVERGLGLITLAALAAAVSLAALLWGGIALPANLLLLIALFGTMVTLSGAMIIFWRGWRPYLEKLPRLKQKASRLTADLAQAQDMFLRPDLHRFRIISFSMALQVVAVLFHVACARAVGLQVPTAVLFLVVPASSVAAMLPISLNGIGVREGVLVGLLAAYGAPAAQCGAFAILALFVSTAFALPGGLVYLVYRKPDVEQEHVSVDT